MKTSKEMQLSIDSQASANRSHIPTPIADFHRLVSKHARHIKNETPDSSETAEKVQL